LKKKLKLSSSSTGLKEIQNTLSNLLLPTHRSSNCLRVKFQLWPTPWTVKAEWSHLAGESLSCSWSHPLSSKSGLPSPTPLAFDVETFLAARLTLCIVGCWPHPFHARSNPLLCWNKQKCLQTSHFQPLTAEKIPVLSQWISDLNPTAGTWENRD
jgi:hypothetical protein